MNFYAYALEFCYAGPYGPASVTDRYEFLYRFPTRAARDTWLAGRNAYPAGGEFRALRASHPTVRKTLAAMAQHYPTWTVAPAAQSPS